MPSKTNDMRGTFPVTANCSILGIERQVMWGNEVPKCHKGI